MIEFLQQLMDVETLIRVGGVAALAAIIFAETGLFFGFFLPGDSLLVTAGLFAARGDLDIVLLCWLLTLCAIVGDAVGFWFGRLTGPALFRRPRSRFFRPEYLKKAHDFYEQHGGKTIVLARFIPILRTFVPIAAGIANMHYRTFFFWNVAGGALWVCGLLLASYFLGSLIPNLEQHIHIIIVIVVFVSILPVIHHIWAERRKGRGAKRA